MTDRQLEERVLRLEQELLRMRRSHAGLEIGAGKNRLGQDTEIHGDLTVSGAIHGTADAADSVPWSGVTGKPKLFVPLTAPLTSTSWDGDARSSVSNMTKIDLSEEFGVKSGVSAVLVRLLARDSASATTQLLYFGVGPANVNGKHAVAVRPSGLTNDSLDENSGICPCDVNGDIYYQCAASGTKTMDLWLEIWGYWI